LAALFLKDKHVANEDGTITKKEASNKNSSMALTAALVPLPTVI
jgi:hypothetical protein